MGFIIYFIVLFVVLGVVLFLPTVSAVFSYQLNKTDGAVGGRNRRNDTKDNSYLKNLVQVRLNTSAYISENSTLVGHTGLKRRVIGKYNNDPSLYDYNIEELIAEDLEEETQAEQRHFTKYKGKEQERNEELV
ncbi:Exp1p Ecym_3346 [Eremothecium cymbalariae DBVPG|uniref:Uncharacterized protein n=1 Tax=Eremothecium cymbalariae (strain CBS 270.75 / DBVPG 7215 / KCTC 17166 / NRRL Y-17582) TaxID=931890 RepID=G8JRR5_ERECY|nr:Hypothetical protein Ecym_3346 [Eremothecium cymbalariae DBVPG\